MNEKELPAVLLLSCADRKELVSRISHFLFERGGNPYRQAYTRGVKIIGATSHFVTEDLDEGPIIEQDIVRITHKDSLLDLKRKGRVLERIVLARALLLHAQHRILVNGKKTIIFD